VLGNLAERFYAGKMVASQTFWVFGYGSLIWRPGFSFVSAQSAYLCGFHRSLCIYSHKYRGTPENPGLVFGLLPGGCCEGRAFEVSGADWPGVLAYLRERETDVYHEVESELELGDGQKVNALTFVADEGHSQFAGQLELDVQMTFIRDAKGETGTNRDYVVNTLTHLGDLGISDTYLSILGEKL
jgi:cation transport protein ChaC